LGPIFAEQGWDDLPFNVYPANSLGQSGAQLIEQAQAPENKLRLREQTRRAKGLGIFGAPNFVVGAELFWGNDRLEDALALAGSRTGESRR
jgi:2-hydroxychromene-2-carboxylate isomerase